MLPPQAGPGGGPPEVRSLWECGSQLLALRDALTRSAPTAAGAPLVAGSSPSLGQWRLAPLSSAAGRACKCWVKPAPADCAPPSEGAPKPALPPPALLASEGGHLLLPFCGPPPTP